MCAISSADMALAGIKSVIPADEVIEAMRAVGAALPQSLRETAQGGLAATPTGIALKQKIFG
jgi:L-serine dehydratase